MLCFLMKKFAFLLLIVLFAFGIAGFTLPVLAGLLILWAALLLSGIVASWLILAVNLFRAVKNSYAGNLRQAGQTASPVLCFWGLRGRWGRHLSFVCRETTKENFRAIGRTFASAKETYQETKFKRIKWVSTIFWLSCCFALLLGVCLFSPFLPGLYAAMILLGMCFYNLMLVEMFLLEGFFVILRMRMSLCPSCRKRHLFVSYTCSQCGAALDLMLPSFRYGAFFRRCQCGSYFPVSWLLGKKKLDAQCPACSHQLSCSDEKFFFTK